MLDSVARFCLTNDFTFAWCCLVIILGIISLIYLGGKLRTVNKWIKKGSKNLPDEKDSQVRVKFAEGWGDINTQLIENEVLGHHWHEFKETMIYPSSVSHGEKSENYRNSIQPQEFFNFERIISEKINLRQIDAIPGKLVGLGVLGTFIGLAAGVHMAMAGFADSTDTEALQGAVSELLNGASLAFLTSIAGLLSSIIFSFIEKFISAKIDRSIAEFNRKLEACLEFVTKEKILDKSYKELEKQTKNLQEFNSDIAASIGDVLYEKVNESFSPAFDKLIDAVNSLKDVQSKASESVLKDLANAVSGDLADVAKDQVNGLQDTFKSVQEGLSNLVQTMTSMQTSVQNESNNSIQQLNKNMLEGQRSFNENMEISQKSLMLSVEKVMNSVETKMNGASSAIIDEMHSSQRKLSEEMVNAMKGLVSNLKKIESASTQNQVKITQGMDYKIDNLNKNFEKIEQISSERQGRFSKEISDLLSLTDRNNKTFQETIDSMGSVVTNLSDLEKSQKFILESNSKAITKVSEISGSLQGFSETIKESNSKIEGLARSTDSSVNLIHDNIQKIEETNKVIMDQWEKYDHRFGEIDSETEKWFKEINSGLKDYGQTINTNLEKIKRGTQNVAGNFEYAAKELTETIGELKGAIEGFNGKRG